MSDDKALRIADALEYASNNLRSVNHQAAAELRRLYAEVERLRAERDHARACVDNAVRLLTSIHSLLYPAPLKMTDGRTMVFRPENPHDYMQALSDRIRALPDELAAIKEAQQAEPQWCACEPTRCDGVGRCRWQAMKYVPPAQQAEPVATVKESLPVDCPACGGGGLIPDPTWDWVRCEMCNPLKTRATLAQQAEPEIPYAVWRQGFAAVKEHKDAQQAEQQASKAALDVQDERQRQIQKEGWTAEHDDEHDLGELAAAAAAYALAAADKQHPFSQGDGNYSAEPPTWWPWDRKWWKPSEARRMLVKAGALTLAAIEQIDRINTAQGMKEGQR